MEYPEDIKLAVKKYFRHAIDRWALAGPKNQMDKTIRVFMLTNNLTRFRHNGAFVDFVERTSFRVDSKAIPMEIKEKYSVVTCTKILVPFDCESKTYKVPFSDNDFNEDEEVVQDMASSETHDEMADMVTQFVTIKRKWKYHDDRCKDVKEFIITFMESHNLEEIDIDGNKLSFIKRVARRFMPTRLPYDMKVEYMVKTKGHTMTVYLQTEMDLVKQREDLEGKTILKELRANAKVQLLPIRSSDTDIID